MIDPQGIDIATLPWLPLEACTAFPRRPAIYFAIDKEGIVQYVGRSVNPRQRWKNHHRYDEINDIGDVNIAYLFIDSKSLPRVEAALIKRFNPPLNRLGKSSNSSSIIAKHIAIQKEKPDPPSECVFTKVAGNGIEFYVNENIEEVFVPEETLVCITGESPGMIRAWAKIKKMRLKTIKVFTGDGIKKLEVFDENTTIKAIGDLRPEMLFRFFKLGL